MNVRKVFTKEEVSRLCDVVKKHKLSNGGKMLNWSKIRAHAALGHFKTSQLRVKYKNVLKSLDRKSKVVSAVQKGNQAFQSTSNLRQTPISFQSAATRTDLQNKEISRITEAVLKVQPYTASSLSFMEYLGYDPSGGKNKTYMELFAAAIKTGKLNADWVAEVRSKILDFSDDRRQVRRDLQALRNADTQVKSLSQCDVSSNPVSEEICSRFGHGTCIQPVNSKGTLESSHTQVGGSGVSVNGSSRIEQLSKEYQHLRETTRNKKGCYNEVMPIRGNGAALLPTPVGYGAQHVSRLMTDNEWRKIILEMQRSRFNIQEDPFLWDQMLTRARINCSRNGLQIKYEFCKYAIPRLQELLLPITFDGSLVELNQEIQDSSRATDIFVFHSMRSLQWKLIMPTLQALQIMKCISIEKNDLSSWRFKFIRSVLSEGKDHFMCSGEELQKLKDDVIKVLLINSNEC